MTIHMTRRTMLRGMGAALALPWMESLPAVARAAAKSVQAAGPDVLLVRSQRRAPADLVPQATRERWSTCPRRFSRSRSPASISTAFTA